MKIAVCQLKIAFENRTENYRRSEVFIKSASSNFADLILFPEMSFTGFSMDTSLTEESHDATLQWATRMAQEYSIGIGFGWVKIGVNGNLPSNHYTVISRNGTVISDYTKLHPFRFSRENEHYAEGDKAVIADYKDCKFSTFICYDLRFPEIFQSVSNEVDYIFVPANWAGVRRDAWMTLLKARALENQVYMVGINCVGDQGQVRYMGDSCIVNPNGDVLQFLSYDEGLLFHETHQDVQDYRERFPLKEDRRDELYLKLMNERM